MITPITARCTAFSYLQKKYEELINKVEVLITEASNNGKFNITIELAEYSYEELMEVKRLFEHEGYLVHSKYSGKDGLVIEW